MRIGIDGRALQDQPWSGVGQYVYHLLQALFELDKANQYHIFYNARGPLSVPEFKEYANVKVSRTHWPNKILNLMFKAKLYKFAQSLALDVFFMPNLNFVALPKSVKLVAVAHDLSFEHFPEHFSRKTRLWHRVIGPRQFFVRADKIIAVSEHTKGDLMETYDIPEEKVSVVYPGVDQVSGVGDQVSGPEPKTWNLKPNSYILYFGALEPRKNIVGIIEAYELLATEVAHLPKLILAGLKSVHVPLLKKQIAQSKLRLSIILKENPTEAEKTELYRGAALFVYPSFYEGFGFPPLEAMSYGVPVVASSASSVPEVCDNAALLVSPWNVYEIKEGMKVLLRNEDLRKEYIAAGFKKAKAYSWRKCAEEVLAILHS